MSKRQSKVHGQGAIFLDPINCGSSIRWHITDCGYGKYPQPSCDISLTDCSRSINWSQECTEEGISKINKAIKILMHARALMKKHQFVHIKEDSE